MKFYPKKNSAFLTPEQVAFVVQRLKDQLGFLVFTTPRDHSYVLSRVVYEKEFEENDLVERDPNTVEEYIMNRMIDLLIGDICKIPVKQNESVLVIGDSPEALSDRDILRRKTTILLSIGWRVFSAEPPSANAQIPGVIMPTVKE